MTSRIATAQIIAVLQLVGFDPISQDRHTYCPGSRAGAPVCQRANPAVAIIRCSWCRAVGFIRAPVGYVCTVGLSCAVCVLAMWLQVWLQDTDDASRRTRVIPVVDRSNNSPIIYIIAFGATAMDCPHQLKPRNRQTHILPGLESRGAGLSKG